jgi:hypothetical protein
VIEMDRDHFGMMTDDRTAEAITYLLVGAT